MLWCLTICAVCCVGLAATALTLDPSRIRPPRISPRRLLRGCLATTLLLAAGVFVTLAMTLAA